MAEMGIGANAQRIDGREKVMGRPLYAADRLPARSVFATPVAATVGKGRITAIDTAAAERVKGVLAVLTYRNMDRLKKVEFSFAGGQAIQSHLPMQAPEVRYRGECIALTVAETPEAAREAASLVLASYDEQPFAVELTGTGGTEVVQAKATAYFPDFVKGDPVPLIDAAPVSVDARYYSAAQHHNPMEMLSTVAEWCDGSLVVHEGTQAAQAMKTGLVIALGLTEDTVRVISPYIGGAFGQRGAISPHTILAAVAARRVGRPVKLTVPRAQIFHATSFRRDGASYPDRRGSRRSVRRRVAPGPLANLTVRSDALYRGGDDLSHLWMAGVSRSHHARATGHSNAGLHACPDGNGVVFCTRECG